MDQAYEDMDAIVGKVPVPPDDMEYDEDGDDIAYTARWRRPNKSAAFSLTFAGNGHVVGCFVYSEPSRRGTVWRLPLNDPSLDSKISGEISELRTGT